MIDVSDGLASEVGHICKMSGVGAVIEKERIPVSKSTKEAAAMVGGDPIEYALGGGEDFELVFTVAKEDLDKIQVDCPLTVVGEIVEKERGIVLKEKGEEIPLVGGFDHFKQE